MKSSKEIDQLIEAYRVICNIVTKLRDIAKFAFMNYCQIGEKKLNYSATQTILPFGAY